MLPLAPTTFSLLRLGPESLFALQLLVSFVLLGQLPSHAHGIPSCSVQCYPLRLLSAHTRQGGPLHQGGVNIAVDEVKNIPKMLSRSNMPLSTSYDTGIATNFDSHNLKIIYHGLVVAVFFSCNDCKIFSFLTLSALECSWLLCFCESGPSNSPSTVRPWAHRM